MQRAYSTFEVKSVNAEQRILEGIASTPTPDMGGDVMEPSGAEFTLPMPLLWFHDQKAPIGEVFEASVRPDGIHVKARIAKVETPGIAKDRVDEAWDSVSSSPPLARGLSIGWKGIEKQKIPGTKFTRYLRWVWGELSVVTVPMNQDATILAVKAASGQSTPSGDSDPLPVVRAIKGAQAMTTQENITAFEATHGANLARMNAIVLEAKGATLDEKQKEEYADLERQNESITEHLPRLKRLEEMNVKSATAITRTATAADASALRGGQVPVVQVKSMLPKGTAFTRYVMTIAAAKGDNYVAEQMARQRWPDTPEVELMVKSAVAAGDTTTSGWASNLAVQQPINEFIELLRPKTLLGRIPNLRRVPFNVSVPAQTAGGTYAWVGQGKVKPLTKATLATVTLAINKIAGIIVLTQELVKISTPSAQELVQAEMIAGVTKFMDEQFIDPSIAASGTVSPASVTNGTSAVTSAGTSNDNARTDLKAVMSAFVTANLALDNSVWVMSEGNQFALAMAVNALGAPLFPSLANGGGTLLGRPVVATQSAGTTVALIDAQGVLVADDGGVSIDISRDASLQMDTAPTDPADAAAVYVSMFQQNMIALRAERFVTWKRARTESVKYVAQTYV